MKKLTSILVVMALVFVFTVTGSAALVPIGTAQFVAGGPTGPTYPLLWDEEASVIWLDYTAIEAIQPMQVIWAASLNTVNPLSLTFDEGVTVTFTSDWRLAELEAEYLVGLRTSGGVGFSNLVPDLYWSVNRWETSPGFFNGQYYNPLAPNGYNSFWEDWRMLYGLALRSATVEILAVAPSVTTQAATAVTTSGATLNGTVNANNGSTDVTFQYGTTIGYGTTVSVDQSPVTGTTNTAVSRAIAGLTSNTTYHYRVVGANAGGTTNGADVTFTTGTVAVAPTVTTQATTDVASTTATGNGDITVLGSSNPTQHGICWSTSTDPTVDDINDFKTTDGAVSATGSFTSSMTGLTPGTLYNVRAYATNSAGTSYGTNVTFTTLAPEINLKQNTINIADGGSHDFGSQATGTDTDLIFTIENTGTADLTLPDTPMIGITGADSSQFSVQTQPISPVTGSSSTTITIRFSPTSTGYKTATIAIANNDSDENPYDLTITGTGTTAGVTVGTLNSTTTNEGGATATFTVVLDSPPSADVEMPLSSSDISEGTVSPTSLTFTSANWDTAQTVTVTGVNDNLFDGNVAYTVEIGPAVSTDSNYNGNDPSDKNLTNDDNDLDSDGDGISDALEGTGDRDGDGVDDCNDYDPTGYLYDSATGEIISGGSISVSGPVGSTVNFISGRNGADGYYQFVVDQTGTYTITVTPPAAYSVDSSGCAASGTLTANSTPNPLVLGSNENGATGYLADYTCGANEWYLTINIQDTTPLILNNNIPLVNNGSIPTLNEWGMIITSCLLALAALTVLRRREDM